MGIILNAIFLSLSFGNKLNLYKSEKDLAETNELKALLERDKIIHEQNEILETLIQERNKEIINKINLLAQQKNEIELQNEKIKHSNEEIDIINQKLSAKNNEISLQNQELEKQNSTLEEIVNKRTKNLKKEKEKAIVAEKLKTSFLNNLDIEINTPMNAIAGFSMMLYNKGLALEKRNEYLTIINNNVDALLESIDNMVLLARIQANAIKSKLTSFKLDTLVTGCQEYFEERTLKLAIKELQLLVDSSNSARSILITSDFDKICQSINKLLSFIMRIRAVGKIHLTINTSNIENINKKKHKLKIYIKFDSKDLEEEKLNFIQDQANNFENKKTKMTQINDFGIEIARGLVEILNGKFEIVISDTSEINFIMKIPMNIEIQNKT